MKWCICFNLIGKLGIEWIYRVWGGIKIIRLVVLFLNRVDIY